MYSAGVARRRRKAIAGFGLRKSDRVAYPKKGGPPGVCADVPATTDPNVQPSKIPGTTLMNSIIIADIDGDGANDVIVTLDRSGLSGLSNDALVWFRNTQRNRPPNPFLFSWPSVPENEYGGAG